MLLTTCTTLHSAFCVHWMDCSMRALAAASQPHTRPPSLRSLAVLHAYLARPRLAGADRCCQLPAFAVSNLFGIFHVRLPHLPACQTKQRGGTGSLRCVNICAHCSSMSVRSSHTHAVHARTQLALPGLQGPISKSLTQRSCRLALARRPAPVHGAARSTSRLPHEQRRRLSAAVNVLPPCCSRWCHARLAITLPPTPRAPLPAWCGPPTHTPLTILS